MASITLKNEQFLKASRIKREVFDIMRPDAISAVVKTDPLICLYGETLLNKHKRKQISVVVSNKVREMGRLLLAIKSTNSQIEGLFDCLKPDAFQSLISATKQISGYDDGTKTFQSPSLALHMGTNLKIVCDVAFKIVLEKRNIPHIKWNNRDEKKQDIKDLRKLIVAHWCNELSSLALKTLKERQWEKPTMLPLASDIQLFQTYIDNISENTYNELKNNINVKINYKKLTECVLVHTVFFNRKRVGDVQYLKIENYNTESGNINQEAFMDSLTNVEKILSKKFKRVVTGGKGSKAIPVLFSERIQNIITCLLDTRAKYNIVPKNNPYLFANPGSEDRWMSGSNIIKKFATNCGANYPNLLTSTKFRKHIATTLQLMSMEEDEIEQIATFMGHTKKTHAEFYRLPQDVYQTAKVAKILMLIEKGRGIEFRGKKLSELELDNDVYYSSESEDEEDVMVSQPSTEQNFSLNMEISEQGYNENDSYSTDIISKKKDDNSENKKCGRVKWTEKEKKTVIDYFHVHIQKKITPKKYECEQLLELKGDILKNKNWVKVKTFVYNTFKNKK